MATDRTAAEEELRRLIEQALARKMEIMFFDDIASKPFGGLFDEPATSTEASDEEIHQKFDEWSRGAETEAEARRKDKFGQFREYNHADLKAETKFYHWSKQDRYGSEAPDDSDVFCATPEGRIIVGEICSGYGDEYNRFLAARSLNDNPVERDYGEPENKYPRVWMNVAEMCVSLELRPKGLDDGIILTENGRPLKFYFTPETTPKDIKQKFETVDGCFDNLYLYGDIDAE